MTHDEKIRFLDNLDAAIRFRKTLREPNRVDIAVVASLSEVRNAFAKTFHMENYTKELNPPAV